MRKTAMKWLMRVFMLAAMGVACMLVMSCARLAVQPTGNQVKLNNFVTELIRQQLPGSGLAKYVFENPRDGWIFFSVSAEAVASGKVVVALDGAPREQAILSREMGQDGEAMRWLPAGKHRLKVWTDGKPKGMIVIRTMPEIMFYRAGDAEYGYPEDAVAAAARDGVPYQVSQRERHGSDRMYLYYWHYVHKNILKNINTLVIGSSGPDASHWAKWFANGKEGKRVITPGGVEQAPDVLYEQWSKSFKSPLDGALIDEFIPPVGKADAKEGYSLGAGFKEEVMDVIRKIHGNPELKGTFYAYLGLPSNVTAKDCRLLMETILPCGYKWVFERYLWPQPTEPEARATLDKVLHQAMLDFKTNYPGCEQSCNICLSATEHWDNLANVDQRVWLDMQVQMLATDPAFDGLYGISYYTSTYADPEIVLWISQLYRHYCIEGQTELLSKRHGYSLMLDHIENVDFAQGKTGWIFTPANEESIRIKPIADLPFEKGYLPTGNHVLTMQRSAEKPNMIRHEIRNLKPGRLYTFKMFSCDVNMKVDMKDEKTWQKYAQVIRFNGAEEIIDRRRQDMMRGSLLNQVCWNYTYRVFRATGDKATLEISDWTNEKTPGGLIGQTIAYNFMKIQPLFEPDGAE